MINPLVVLTGGTGSFGRFLIESLVKESPELKLVLLIRADSQHHAMSRFHKLGLPGNYAQKIKVIRSDLNKSDLGLSPKEFDSLAKTTTHILHAAASTRFTLPLLEARRNNVETTEKMIIFAKSCSALNRFAYVSTAFVAGKRTGTVYESELEHHEGFLNTYEQSKYEAELLVRQMGEALPLAILRPSLILTVRHGSATGPQNALALGISLAGRGFLPILPGQPNNTLDIISGDYASRAIAKLLLKNRLNQACYHIASTSRSPKISQIITLIEDTCGKKLPIRFTGSADSFASELKKTTRFRPDLKLIYKKVETFLPELAHPKSFDNHNLREELGNDLKPGNVLDEIRLLLR